MLYLEPRQQKLVGFKRVWVNAHSKTRATLCNDLSVLGCVDVNSINEQKTAKLKVLAGDYVFSTVNLDARIYYNSYYSTAQNR